MVLLWHKEKALNHAMCSALFLFSSHSKEMAVAGDEFAHCEEGVDGSDAVGNDMSDHLAFGVCLLWFPKGFPR